MTMYKNETAICLLIQVNISKINYLLLTVLSLFIVDTAQAFAPTAEFGHVGITRDGLTPIIRTLSNTAIARFSDKAILDTRKANADVDDLRGEFFIKAAHCDDENLPGCSQRIIDIKNLIIDNLRNETTRSGVEARRQLGKALHTLQDFYAHSNWVNNPGPAHTDINFDLGRGLLTRLPPSVATCKDDFFDRVLIGAGLSAITTGYFGGFEPPDSKCAHGVVTVLGEGTGIHKDNPRRPFFGQARTLAVKSTTDLVNQILDAPGVQDNDAAIRAFMDVGVQLRTLGFVIDDSGSMFDEIDGVKNSVAEIIAKVTGSGHKPDQFLLERFSDPFVQRPPFVTPDPRTYLAAVNEIDPSGGGDCPELSQEGLLVAIGATHSGSALYFYSDASAKDAFLAPLVWAAALLKNIKINYILTGSCSPVDPAYIAGAQKTGGQVFDLRSDETAKISSLIEPSLSGDLEPLLIVNDTLTDASKEHLIPIDSTITAVTFSITADTTSTIKVTRPTGEEVTTSDPDTNITDVSSGRIIRVAEPATGIWHLQVSGTGKFSASVMGNSPIRLDNFSFVELRGRLVHEGLFPIPGQPMAGEPLTALANVVGPFETVTFELRSEAGGVLQQSINLIEGGSEEAALDDFVGSFDLPREVFRVYAKGTDQNGFDFIRAFPPAFLGQTVSVTADVYALELMPEDTTTVRFEVANLGVPDTFNIIAMDDRGFVTQTSPENIRLGTNESATVQVVLSIPQSTPDETRAALTVVAQSVTNSTVSNSAVTNIEVIRSAAIFDAFGVKQLRIKFGQGVDDDGPVNTDRFKMKAFFTLGSDSDGIHPDTEPVGLQIGTFSTTIPPGSFQAEKRGSFRFRGVIDGVALKAVIRPSENGRFKFTVQGTDANLMGTVNPVKVSLSIGNDSGDTTVMAEFENDERQEIEAQDNNEFNQ